MNRKSFWKGFLTGGFLALLFILVLGLTLYRMAVQPDVSLSEFELYNLEGEPENLKKYVGKPIVVNCWATWCAPCIAEFPYFEKVKQELGDDVTFVMISDETEEKIAQYSNTNDFTFTYLRSDKTFEKYGILARPTTYFYNAQGELVTKHTSKLDTESLKEYVEKIR